mmetsp:Transcript_16740/g.14642  ORF Transcript_16740/g.14642 Transcript_16740/m.14642 type:complete len:105 (+) Transcript_16740:2681-2995(+)
MGKPSSAHGNSKIQFEKAQKMDTFNRIIINQSHDEDRFAKGRQSKEDLLINVSPREGSHSSIGNYSSTGSYAHHYQQQHQLKTNKSTKTLKTSSSRSNVYSPPL